MGNDKGDDSWPVIVAAVLGTLSALAEVLFSRPGKH